MTTTINRDAMAEAVHLAVCQFEGGDKLGKCYLYTVAGWSLMMQLDLDPKTHTPQAGSLYLTPDPDDPDYKFAFDARDGGTQRGEYHTWIGIQGDGPGGCGALVDFSARHYRRYTDQLLKGRGPVTRLEGGFIVNLAEPSDVAR